MQDLSAPPPRRRFALLFLAGVIVMFTAASASPTPMYHLYRETWHFSPTVLTLVFAIYVFTLLISLLVFGSASDHIGRRPVILIALLIEMVSMVIFLIAQDVTTLLIARAVQGFATGIATAALGAALFDHDHHNGPLINSISPLLGLASGAVISGILVEYAPSPLHLSYAVMLAGMAGLLLCLIGLPETAPKRPGFLRALKPRLAAPLQARQTLFEIIPANCSAWALGGFYFSFAPSVIASATGAPASLSGGIAVACLTLSGALSVLIWQKRNPTDTLLFGTFTQSIGIIILVAGIASGMLVVFFAGSLCAGFGFGANFLGSVRSLLPRAEPHERGGLMATFYVLSYLSFCVPAILAAEFITSWGLIGTAEGYGIVLFCVTVLALGLQIRKRQKHLAAAGNA